MDASVAVTKLCEYHGIPPHHNSVKRGDENLLKTLEGEFQMPLADIEKKLKFDQVKNAYDNHMRRVGKEITSIVKQITR